MKMAELRKLTDEQLQDKLDDARDELMRFRFQQSTGELKDTSRIPQTRQVVAQILTLIRERKNKTEGAA